MRLSTQRGGSGKSTKSPSAKQRAPTLKLGGKSKDYTLPTEKTAAFVPLEKCVQLWHGDPKIGKTSTLSRFEDAFCIMTEPGDKGIPIYREYGFDWEDIRGWVKSILKTKRFPTVVLDVTDKAYDYCLSYVCAKNNWKWPGDAPYGQGWRTVRDEFQEPWEDITKSGRGLVFVCHSKVQEFQRRSGQTFNKVIPSLGSQAYDYCWGAADIEMHLGFYGSERYMTVVGNDWIEAGHRFEKQFRAKNGKAVVAIPMGDNPDESYMNLLNAYNNKQRLSGKPKDGPGSGVSKVKMGANSKRR